MANTIAVKLHRPGGSIVMQRPGVGNALSLQMITDLEQALDDLHQEKQVRYIILAGSGDHFCTGIDLKVLDSIRASQSPDSMHELYEIWQRLADLLIKILRYPKPLIAAVDGTAMGAGWALALACDMIVASERATFASPAPQRGFVGGLVAPLLWFRSGGSLAARWLLTSETVTAAEALRTNLVSTVSKSDQVWVTADTMGQETAKAPAEAMQMTKRLLNETIGEWLTSQLVVAAGMGATACSTEAAAEGLRAFMEKRSPTWP